MGHTDFCMDDPSTAGSGVLKSPPALHCLRLPSDVFTHMLDIFGCSATTELYSCDCYALFVT